MLVFVNGRLVPEEQALLSVFDRGFLYGDGLFETLRVVHGKPFRWSQHLERLERGAEFLKLKLPCAPDEMRRWANELIVQNQMPESVLRLTLSRGVGVRGYSPKGAGPPTLVMSLHPAPAADPQNPPRWRVITSSFRVPVDEPLMNLKTCNKLPQILARAEAEAMGVDEALLLNTSGEVAEAAGSNLFWIGNGVVWTTPLAAGVLAGVTRAVVLELCQRLGLVAEEASITPQALAKSDSAFLSSSALGLVEVAEVDGLKLGRLPLTKKLQRAFEELVQQESV
ncbi:MAG TPA: aminotransferase class IV [Verrucomicrobiae bacterium]|jgi:aminodeoxychorismate lyase